MSIFDLFRGFFGVPGGHYGRYGPREPFFDSMTHDDEEEDEDDDACYSGSFGGPGERDPFDDSWRFGFSMGPNGMRLHEPAMFGQILRDMEEIFAELGRFDDSRHGHFGLPPLEPPPPQGRGPRGLEPGGSSDGSCLRDSMLKGPEDRGPRPPAGPPPPSGPPPPGSQRSPPLPSSPFGHWSSPFSRFHDGFRDRLFSAPQNDRKEDGDLDSQVSSGGLDQILTPAQPAPAPAPAPSQPRIRSFFQSVTVKKVVKPDGSVEETRTVRDGQGNEETTVTRSGGSGHPEDANGPGPLLPGGLGPFDMQDDTSLFSRFFGGFRG